MTVTRIRGLSGTTNEFIYKSCHVSSCTIGVPCFFIPLFSFLNDLHKRMYILFYTFFANDQLQNFLICFFLLTQINKFSSYSREKNRITDIMYNVQSSPYPTTRRRGVTDWTGHCPTIVQTSVDAKIRLRVRIY